MCVRNTQVRHLASPIVNQTRPPIKKCHLVQPVRVFFQYIQILASFICGLIMMYWFPRGADGFSLAGWVHLSCSSNLHCFEAWFQDLLMMESQRLFFWQVLLQKNV